MTKKILTTLTLGLALTAVSSKTLEAAPLKHKVLRDGKVSVTLDAKPNKGFVKIIPNGFKESNKPIKWDVDGVITDAKFVQMDRDSYPELVIFMRNNKKKRETVKIFSSRENRRLDQVLQFNLSKKHSKGYKGRDMYRMRGNKVVRTFPIYKKGDSMKNPTGGLRTVIYDLDFRGATKVMNVKSVK